MIKDGNKRKENEAFIDKVLDVSTLVILPLIALIEIVLIFVYH